MRIDRLSTIPPSHGILPFYFDYEDLIPRFFIGNFLPTEISNNTIPRNEYLSNINQQSNKIFFKRR